MPVFNFLCRTNSGTKRRHKGALPTFSGRKRAKAFREIATLIFYVFPTKLQVPFSTLSS
jgi:hypothetical protein